MELQCEIRSYTSNIGGPAEIIENRKTGILVEPGRSELLANEILNLLNDEKRKKTIGANARKVVTQKYSWERIAGIYHQLYSELL